MSKYIGGTKIIDLVGETFGCLTVVSMLDQRDRHGSIFWRCRCSCGNYHTVLGGNLRRGLCTRCKSCSIILKIKDLTGQTFGELKVISVMPGRYGIRKVVKWRCECSCGKFRVVEGYRLRSGEIKSCGCPNSNKIKNREDALLVRQYRILLRYTDKKLCGGKPISFEVFKKLVFGTCHYCGTTSSKKLKNRVSDIVIHINGIDRIDSSKGYVEGNVVPCCAPCNRAKMDGDVQNFEEHLDKLAQYQLSNMSEDEFKESMQQIEGGRLEKLSNQIPKALKPRKKPRVRYQHRDHRHSNTQRGLTQC